MKMNDAIRELNHCKTKAYGNTFPYSKCPKFKKLCATTKHRMCLNWMWNFSSYINLEVYRAMNHCHLLHDKLQIETSGSQFGWAPAPSPLEA